jgi:sugar/nucleoside kinase (ribokinase family)
VLERRSPIALLVGSLTRDVWADAPGLEASPGGVVHHAGPALARLGLEVRVVTRLAARDRAELAGPLERAGVQVHALPSRETTTYRNDYSGESDSHVLLACSDPIQLDDIPPGWRTADLVQLGPLHPADVAPEVPAGLAAIIGLDAQGWVRARPDEQRRADQQRRAHDVGERLRHVDVLQVSESDLGEIVQGASPESFAAACGLAELIVTRGARGASVWTSGSRADVPARPVRPRDARAKAGSGDVFLACYLWQRAAGADPAAAARVAAAICSIKLVRGELPAGLDAKEFAA